MSAIPKVQAPWAIALDRAEGRARFTGKVISPFPILLESAIAEGGSTFGVNRALSCWKKSKIGPR
jgi:hypothetical protein